MYPTVYHHNGFPAIDALGHMIYKAILVIIERTHGLHDYITLCQSLSL